MVLMTDGRARKWWLLGRKSESPRSFVGWLPKRDPSVFLVWPFATDRKRE
jgi:hypothetical protein